MSIPPSASLAEKTSPVPEEAALRQPLASSMQSSPSHCNGELQGKSLAPPAGVSSSPHGTDQNSFVLKDNSPSTINSHPEDKFLFLSASFTVNTSRAADRGHQRAVIFNRWAITDCTQERDSKIKKFPTNNCWKEMSPLWCLDITRLP